MQAFVRKVMFQKNNPEKVSDLIIDALTDFTFKLENGKAIEVTEVRREETPDGPLHTFKKVKKRLGKKQ